MFDLKERGRTMLELRTYAYAELSALFGTRDTQGIKRRLNNYEIEYTVEGRGALARFNINKINDPFKVFCIIDLNFAPQTDFSKLVYFFYYLFNDDEFLGLPRETMEARMKADNHTITRQTIQTYLDRLSAANLINQQSMEYRYYFAKGDTQRETTKEEYSASWKQYWQHKEQGADSRTAIAIMCADYGGVARKQQIIEINGIYNNTISQINDMVCACIEADVDNYQQPTSLDFHIL